MLWMVVNGLLRLLSLYFSCVLRILPLSTQSDQCCTPICKKYISLL